MLKDLTTIYVVLLVLSLFAGIAFGVMDPPLDITRESVQREIDELVQLQREQVRLRVRMSELIEAIPEDLPHRCHPVSPSSNWSHPVSTSANWRTAKKKANKEWELVGTAKTDESEVGAFHEAKKVLDRNGIAFDLSVMHVEGVERPCLRFYLTEEMLNDTQRYHKFIISLGLEPRVLKEPRAA